MRAIRFVPFENYLTLNHFDYKTEMGGYDQLVPLLPSSRARVKFRA